MPKQRESKPIDVAELRVLVETYYDIQHQRLIAENRVRAAVTRQGLDEVKAKALEAWVDEGLARQEAELKAMVLRHIRGHPLWERWLKDVVGVGPCICGGLLAWLRDIGRFATVSKTWAYSGLHTIDGQAVRRVAGQKSNWNPKLKTLLWKAAVSFAMSGGSGEKFRVVMPSGRRCSHKHPTAARAMICAFHLADEEEPDEETLMATPLPDGYEVEPFDHEASGYRQHYDDAKARIKAAHPEPMPWDPPRYKRPEPGAAEDAPKVELMRYSDGHIDNMAKRWVAKLFLAHVWEEWRRLEGLPIRAAYVVEHLGHTTVIPVVRR